jgi:uncharacterized protein (DUF433 family)
MRGLGFCYAEVAAADGRSALMETEIAPRIVVNPNVGFGKPVIRGTRIPVELIVGQLAGGMSVEEIVSEYEISAEDVRAALKYAADILSTEAIRATG